MENKFDRLPSFEGVAERLWRQRRCVGGVKGLVPGPLQPRHISEIGNID
jgi:hypothetical protein